MTARAPDTAPTDGSALLTPRELALRWRMSLRTIERWRADRYGPPWLVIGGRILYRQRDIVAFEDRHTKAGG